MYGVKEEYPIQLRVGASAEFTSIANDEQLYEALEKVLSDPTLKKIKLGAKCEMIGLENTMQLFDNRTVNIFEEYLYYMKAPHQAPYNNRIWRDSVKLLNPIFEQRLF